MRTGQHKHRITFYQDMAERVANGDINGVLAPVLEMWAKVTPLTGSRALNAGQILNGKPYEIEVRNPSPLVLTEDMLINWNGTWITIHSVVDKDAESKILLITGAHVK